MNIKCPPYSQCVRNLQSRAGYLISPGKQRRHAHLKRAPQQPLSTEGHWNKKWHNHTASYFGVASPSSQMNNNAAPLFSEMWKFSLCVLWPFKDMCVFHLTCILFQKVEAGIAEETGTRDAPYLGCCTGMWPPSHPTPHYLVGTAV